MIVFNYRFDIGLFIIYSAAYNSSWSRNRCTMEEEKEKGKDVTVAYTDRPRTIVKPNQEISGQGRPRTPALARPPSDIGTRGGRRDPLGEAA
jgi:hypothetical protein